MIDVPNNVNDFINECSKIVGNYEAEDFRLNMYADAEDRDSPIEQLFESAFRTVIKIGYYFDCVQWYPQMKIGKYIVDYVFWHTENKTKVVVELDGHEFHEKNEYQRRYEKRRDRELQKQGYKVFRFTGSEIVKNPFSAAIEVIAYIANDIECDMIDNLKLFGMDERWQNIER